MATFQVQKRVETETRTEIYNECSVSTIEEAQAKFQEVLAAQDVYAGEFYESDEKGDYTESIEIVDEEGEEIQSERVFIAGRFDKNNYKGNYPVWYWGVAKWNGTELIYNFHNNGFDLDIEYADVKHSDLANWYNYKR